MMKLVLPAAALSLAACAAYAGSVRGDAPNAAEQRALAEGRAVGEPQSCVTVRDIEDTDALTDRVVLFHMKNGRTYRNDLPNSCPQLTRDGSAFAFTTPIGRLCAIDVVQIAEPSSGFRYGGCQLGKFTRYELPQGLNPKSF